MGGGSGRATNNFMEFVVVCLFLCFLLPFFGSFILYLKRQPLLVSGIFIFSFIVHNKII